VKSRWFAQQWRDRFEVCLSHTCAIKFHKTKRSAETNSREVSHKLAENEGGSLSQPNNFSYRLR
jgi:hypothetical protein